jgi:beta-N-acetylhexosaminidase
MVSYVRTSWLILLILASFALPLRAGEATPAPDDVADAAAAYDASGNRWAERALRHMSLEEKVGQLLMPWARVEFMNQGGPEFARLRDMMQRYHLGSFAVTVPQESGALLRGSPYDVAALTNALQHESPLPLLFAADFERGLPMRLRGGTGFPHAMAFGAAGDPQLAYEFGRVTAEEARAIGVQWNFYPDADVNSNPNNPIINTRAFGEDPAQVGAMVAAFVRGAHAGHGMATAKHFPGHGDTETDSHIAVPRLMATRSRLDALELVPFRAAMAAGVDAVMVAHLLVPSLEPDLNRTAVISHNITTALLRGQLGFRGLVVTDAMDMNGVTRLFGGNTPQSAGRAAVEALAAGNDLILIPGDLEGAYNGILAAVRGGELSEDRIDESVLRILRAKAALGLHKNRLVDLSAVEQKVSRPENVALAQRVADSALTLVRQNTVTHLLPLARSQAAPAQFSYHAAEAASNRLLALIFVDDVRGENGRAFARELLARAPDARVIYVDEANASLLAPQALEAAANAERVVAAVYVTPSAGRTAVSDGGSPALPQGGAAVLGNLLRASGAKTVVVSLGTPYLIAQYPAIENYVCTFSNMPVSELSAVRFLFGEIPARGQLPVTIPGVAARQR